MTTSPVELVVGRAPPAKALEGRGFKNIRHFAGVPFSGTEGVKVVYVEPDHGDDGDLSKSVADVYKAAGAEVHLTVPKTAAKEEAAPAPKSKG